MKIVRITTVLLRILPREKSIKQQKTGVPIYLLAINLPYISYYTRPGLVPIIIKGDAIAEAPYKLAERQRLCATFGSGLHAQVLMMS